LTIGFREKSTKTRIETYYACSFAIFPPHVLEKNPPKQGLKRQVAAAIGGATGVLEKNPPKQGLKPRNQSLHRAGNKVLEKNPPKQGLKPVAFSEIISHPESF